ncbi:MAG: type I-F CRISPR-associated protein Csy2 [Granulosicoccaceae bacterium]
MKSLLIVPHLQVENANAISGMTWGFPAISNFLGFTHALSRKLEQHASHTLGGCAVVCHGHSVQAYQPSGWGDYVFSLTRNPLTKDSRSPPFVEEGRMHMEVTLLIECHFSVSDLDFGGVSDEEDAAHLETWIQDQLPHHRLAGGTIATWEPVRLKKLPQQQDAYDRFVRKTLLQLLPGFVLVDRGDLWQHHHKQVTSKDAETALLDSWLDFIATYFKANSPEKPESSSVAADKSTANSKWHRVPKPASGWLVPISIGYKAISPLYKPGEVLRSRDMDTPYRFTEAVYSIGQWISPHRVRQLESIFWRYHHEGGWYLCKNLYSRESRDTQTVN